MPFLRLLKKEQKRFTKTLSMLLAAFFIFGGPTYLLYILDKFEVPRLLILFIGLTAFTVGVILFAYLSKEEKK